jgi:predicted ATPase
MENGEKKTVSRKVIDREVIMRKYHVHIKNFRNLKDVKVTLSPLTILTGENGSGKSTLFKALLFLKHNHDHEAAKKLKYVIDDDINLGGWEHIANDPKKPISIKITEETWGYDHEVEEIYDIDNCPFELNPTEEYAEIGRKPRKTHIIFFVINIIT